MKNINTAGKTALAAGHVQVIIAAELDIDTGVYIRVHTGFGDKTIDGNTYNGIGDLGKISAVEQTGKAVPSGITLELNGVDPNLLAQVFNYHYQGRPAKIILVILNTNDYTTIDEHTIFKGKIDTMDVQSGETGIVKVKVENRLVDWMRSDNSRYTQEDYERNTGQTDGFYKQLAEVVNKQIEFTPYTSWKQS